MIKRFSISGLLGVMVCAVLAMGPGVVIAQDPALPGPYQVEVVEYDFGTSAFRPSDFPISVEVLANVHYPAELEDAPYPLIIFMHGRHSTCYNSEYTYLQWPCWTTNEPIPSYQGYDYIAEILASQGYVVVSISANGISAYDNLVADRGMQARAELIQHHLELWRTFNTTGAAPFDNLFVGAVDLTNVGTMGHSRGGEGVVRHYLLNVDQGSPFGIRGVYSLAPVDFSRWVLNQTPLAVMLPYCDGDVYDLQGVHLYDDARYNLPGDPARKHNILVMGANHNFFNTIWTPSIFAPGSIDDWLSWNNPDDPHCGDVEGNARLTDEQQRATALAYVSAFFRTYLGGETEFLPMLTATAPPPESAMTDQLFVSFHAPDDPQSRLDVNRLQEDDSLINNNLGGEVTQVDLSPYDLCGGEFAGDHCLIDEPSYRQPHTRESTLAPELAGLSQLQFAWDATTAVYENLLPEDNRDVSNYSLLQFRVSVNFADPRNSLGMPQDFSVILTDREGHSSSTRVSEHSEALYYPPGDSYVIPKVLLNMVAIPLDVFQGVELTDIQSVGFAFDRESEGGLLITELAFSNAGDGVEPVAMASADLSIEMTDSPDPVRLGKELTYRIEILNAGPDTATGVTLIDNLPPEVSFKEASDDCDYADGIISCPSIGLPAGQSEEYEFKVIVRERPADGRLENTASVAAEQNDPDGSNNSLTVTTRLGGGSGGGSR